MNLLVNRFGKHASLDEHARAALEGTPYRAISHQRRASLASVGDAPRHALVLESGYAVAQVLHRNGDRSISAIYLPGDILHLNSQTELPLSYSVEALTSGETLRVEHGALNALASQHLPICQALRSIQFKEEERVRAVFTSVARGDAYDRLGSLLLSLWQRGQEIGLVRNGSMELPLTQTDLADALGLTSVHVNRTLQRLRADGLVSCTGGMLAIADPQRLMQQVSTLGFRPGGNASPSRPEAKGYQTALAIT